MNKTFLILTVLGILLNVQKLHADELKTPNTQNLWHESLEFE